MGSGISLYGPTAPRLVFNVGDRGASPSATAAVNTAAIQATITACGAAGGGTVFLPNGIYKYNGGLLVSSDSVIINGDKSTLKKMSTTAVGLTVDFGINYTNIRDLYFDNNGLAGVAFKYGGHYGQISGIKFTGVITPDYAMWINGANLTSFSDITFGTNYGGLLIDDVGVPTYGALHSNFNNISVGLTTVYSIAIYNSQALKFDSTYVENPIYIVTPARNIMFMGLIGETGALGLMVLDAAQNISVDGGKIFNAADCGVTPWFSLHDVLRFSLSNYNMLDAFSGANRPYITMDGCSYPMIKDIMIRNSSGNAHYFISASGTRSDYVSIDNIWQYSTGTISNLLKIGYSSIKNSNLIQAFVVGSQFLSAENISGALDTSNVAYGFNLINCPTVTDVSNLSVISGADGVVTRFASLASPGSGELVLGTNSYTGNTYEITGTNNITSISAASSMAGRFVFLKFAGILTFTDGNNLKLAGNLVTAGNTTIALICDGTNWYEVARSVN